MCARCGEWRTLLITRASRTPAAHTRAAGGPHDFQAGRGRLTVWPAQSAEEWVRDSGLT